MRPIHVRARLGSTGGQLCIDTAAVKTTIPQSWSLSRFTARYMTFQQPTISLISLELSLDLIQAYVIYLGVTL